MQRDPSPLEALLQRCPSNWTSISLPAYTELQELEADTTLEGVDRVLEQLAVLLDTDTSDPLFDELSMDDFFDIVPRLAWLAQPPRPVLAQDLGVYRFKPLNELALGEFIDLEHWNSGDWSSAPRIAAILYKQHRVDEWSETVWEPYGYDLSKREQAFSTMSVSAVAGMYDHYRVWRTDFMEKYAILFEDNSRLPDDWVEEPIDPADRKAAADEAAQAAANKQWSWEHMMFSLTGGDVSRFGEVFASNVVLVFNVLGMRKVLDV